MKRKWRLQFSIGALLIIMSFVAVFTAWRADRMRLERQVIELKEELGKEKNISRMRQQEALQRAIEAKKIADRERQRAEYVRDLLEAQKHFAGLEGKVEESNTSVDE